SERHHVDEARHARQRDGAQEHPSAFVGPRLALGSPETVWHVGGVRDIGGRATGATSHRPLHPEDGASSRAAATSHPSGPSPLGTRAPPPPGPTDAGGGGAIGRTGGGRPAVPGSRQSIVLIPRVSCEKSGRVSTRISRIACRSSGLRCW